jgi:hypothetical protein
LQLIALIIGIVAAIIALALGLRLMALERRFGLALGTTESGNLEKQLQTNLSEITSLSARLGELAEEYARLATAQSLSSQKISIVRFNPFGDTGGDQSFSLAVLDAHDSGYVLTSIHGRQGTRVYVKPIDFGKSKHQLSEEEQQVLAQAQKRTIEKKK